MTREQVVTLPLTLEHLQVARAEAKRAEMGGRSNIRKSERMAALAEDQLVGQLGTLAGHLLLFGDQRGYRESRWFANLDPKRGDGGSDVPGANVDFKTSLMRYGRNPMRYRLAVRPRERHAGTVYVLVLVEEDDGDYTAHVVGWITDEDLPLIPDQEGPFAGAFTVSAIHLNPLMPLRWWKVAA